MSENGGKPGPLCSAGGAIICLLAFSALNCWQKTHLNAAVLVFSCSVNAQARGALAAALLGLSGIFGYRAWSRWAPSEAAMPVGLVSRSERVRNQDPLLSLRAAACFIVLLGHGIGFAFRPAPLVAMIKAGSCIWLITSAPEAGVWVFFTLSGYLIGKGFFSGRYGQDRDSILRFYRNRLLRIMPLYWFTLTVFCLITIPGIFAPANLPAFLNMLFFNVDGNLPYMPIGALWSISTEMQFYFAAPFLFVILRACAGQEMRFLALAGVVAGAAILCRGAIFAAGGLACWFNYAYQPLIANLDLFLIGMVVSRYTGMFRLTGPPIRHGLLFGVLILGLLYCFVTYLRAHGVLLGGAGAGRCFSAYAPSLTALLTGAVIFMLESNENLGGAPWRRRVLALGGQAGLLSYAAYSWHEPIFLAVRRHVKPPGSIEAALLVFFLAMAVVSAIAFIVYRLVERPFEKLKY